MKKFLLLLHEDIEAMQKLSPKEMETLVNDHLAWAKKIGEQGHLLEGEGLQETGVQLRGKDSVIKDGPYIESKEMIGGFYLLQADSLDTIVAIAKECPCHLWGGTTEIRPIEDYEQ
ncbi:MAG: YciI family protein [Cyclobacteriaceae bacterium]